jgi:uncharacterized protein
MVRSKKMTRDEVIARLKREEPAIRRFRATALYLFGSAARDELEAESDIDLYLDYDHSNPPDLIEMSQLSRHLSHALNREIDLGTRDGLHPRLRPQIERESIRVI